MPVLYAPRLKFPQKTCAAIRLKLNLYLSTMVTDKKSFLGSYLEEKGKISKEELNKVFEYQSRNRIRVGKALTVLGFISEDDLCGTVAEILDIPYIKGSDFQVKNPVLDLFISMKYLKEYVVFPLEKADGKLTVIMADPFDFCSIDDLRTLSGCDVAVCVGREEEILNALSNLYGTGESTLDRIIGNIEGDELEEIADDSDDPEHLRDLAQEAPVIKLVNHLINKAVEDEASDIHIESFEAVLKIRFRVDGVLYDVESPPKRLQAAVISRIKIMSEMNIAERRLPQDGRIRIRVLGKKVDLRVSTIPTLYGESVVMRILNQSSICLEMEKLGFPVDVLSNFDVLIKKPHGIILVTGPTGSGKTTTLYSALGKLNSPDKKIITVEDPVEYQLSGVNQIQVKSKIGLTFSSGLRSIVRQDPDIMMIGEIRDLETAEIAIQSALTGHMVFSTLHTNDAPGAISRLLDMGAESFLISSCLEGVLAQRLVRVVCESCRIAIEPDEKLKKVIELCKTGVIYKSKGCPACKYTGYRGRRGIYELMVVSDEVRQMINEKRSTNLIRRQAVSQGMITLRNDGWRNVASGVTTVEEVLRVTQEVGLVDA